MANNKSCNCENCSIDCPNHRDENSKLSYGRIPPRTVCPWRDNCMTASVGKCNHKGLAHKNRFSCGLARAFDMTDSYIESVSVARLIAANLIWNQVNVSPHTVAEQVNIS